MWQRKNSKEKERLKENGGQMNSKVEVNRELKTRKPFSELTKFKELSTFRYDAVIISLRYITLAVFTAGCLEDYYEKVQSKKVLRKFEISAR